ncbi:MAG: hypothetical protein JWR61_943 [Ferruginibacter sp.]|jgi:hypothetical protein|nr:hypothetical protein [Ferruginibacter sp.]
MFVLDADVSGFKPVNYFILFCPLITYYPSPMVKRLLR